MLVYISSALYRLNYRKKTNSFNSLEVLTYSNFIMADFTVVGSTYKLLHSSFVKSRNPKFLRHDNYKTWYGKRMCL